MRRGVLVLVAALVAGPGWGAGVPTLTLSAEWPEQKIETNVIHKTRPPRGGWIDVIATVDLTAVTFRRRDRVRVVLTASPELAPVKTFIDGKERPKALTTVELENVSKKSEVRWRFRLGWTPRKAESEYTFAAQVKMPRGYGDLKRSITLEQGISCYDTTYLARLKMLAKSTYCRLEPIGKSSFGREMWFLRVSDFSKPNAGKKKFVIIGAFHGNEPSGHGSILDLVYELTTQPGKKRTLEVCILYIVPCMNPDGREAAQRNHPEGTDMNMIYDAETVIAEGKNVATVLEKYKPQLAGAISMTTHQWGRPHLLLSHDCKRKGGWSDVLMKNVGIRVSNGTGKAVHVRSNVPDFSDGWWEIRRYMYQRIGLPSFVLETHIAGYDLGGQMQAMVDDLQVYYAVLDQLIEPKTVKPKLHPPVKMTFPPGKNYQVFKVATPPTIDGKLDETCWKRASIITNFTTSGRRPQRKGRTAVHVVYDDRNLYVACDVPDLKKSKTMPGEEGRLWAEPGVNFFLDTNLNRWSYFQFTVNSNAAVASGYWPIPSIGDSDTFQPKGVTAAAVANGAIEIRIPFASLNGHAEMVDPAVPSPPKPGTMWGVNFFRNVHDASWAPMRGTSHAPWEFNAMTFTGKTR